VCYSGSQLNELIVQLACREVSHSEDCLSSSIMRGIGVNLRSTHDLKHRRPKGAAKESGTDYQSVLGRNRGEGR
jgi:hypothetical protein